MELSDREILHVARLARLRLTADELEPLRQDLNRVLDYVSQLQSLDLAGVEPTLHAAADQAPLRKDIETASLSVAEATKNGPKVEQHMFLVPRIMEGGSDDE